MAIYEIDTSGFGNRRPVSFQVITKKHVMFIAMDYEAGTPARLEIGDDTTIEFEGETTFKKLEA